MTLMWHIKCYLIYTNVLCPLKMFKKKKDKIVATYIWTPFQNLVQLHMHSQQLPFLIYGNVRASVDALQFVWQ